MVPGSAGDEALVWVRHVHGIRDMPERETLKRSKKTKRQGKAPTTQAGEFVREEVHHIRAGKHGARSTKQAIAIGLPKARRAAQRPLDLADQYDHD